MYEDALNDSESPELFQFHNTEPQGFIHRVIEPLRSVNSKGYEPEILAIGPYHHGEDKYKMMEEHKQRYRQSILSRKGENIAERFISVVSEFEEEARSCYADPVKLSKDKFIEMLVLDGCFIIELALKERCPNYNSTDPIFSVELIRCSLSRDLILFENQIPFFILCKLFDLIEEPNQYNRLIDLLLNFDYLFRDSHYRMANNRSRSEVKHLLY